MSLKTTNDDNFLVDVLMQPGKVIVEFWSTTCNPCKMLTPIMESLASEGHNIIAANVAENQGAVAAYGIRSVPTILIAEDGIVKGTHNAAMKNRQQILSLIQ
jgi:thioredoxin 1